MRPRRAPLLAVCAALAATLGALGCGGGSDPSDEEQIRTVLERAFVDAGAEVCREAFTERALEQTQFDDPRDPLESCIENAEDADDDADAITVPVLTLAGDRATATVTPSGGNVDGATMELALLNRDGWRIDEIIGMRIDDRERFLDAGLADIAEDDTFTPPQGRCVADWVREEVPDSALERMYPDEDISFVYDAMRNCLGDGTDYGTISSVVRQQLMRREGLSRSQAGCLIARLRPLLERYRLENFEEIADDRRFRAAAAAAGLVCIGPGGPQGTPPPDPT